MKCIFLTFYTKDLIKNKKRFRLPFRLIHQMHFSFLWFRVYGKWIHFVNFLEENEMSVSNTGVFFMNLNHFICIDISRFDVLSFFKITNQIVVYITRSKQLSLILERSRQRGFQRRESIPRPMHPSLNARKWATVCWGQKWLAAANVKWGKQQSKDEENSHVKYLCRPTAPVKF